MKYKVFSLRSINLVLIIGLLAGYQFIQEYRSQAEEIAKLKYQLATIQQKTSETKQDQTESDVDGVYTGEADGFGGKITVEVTVKEEKLSDIRVVSAQQEDDAYLEMAMDMVDTMKSEHSVAVDTVSGATFTSMGIKDAVKNALEQVVQTNEE